MPETRTGSLEDAAYSGVRFSLSPNLDDRDLQHLSRFQVHAAWVRRCIDCNDDKSASVSRLKLEAPLSLRRSFYLGHI